MTSPGGNELAVAYVSLVIEGSKIPGQVQKSLSGLDAQADKAGRSMGSRLSAGIGATFRTAAAGIGFVAGAAIGTALNKGFQRMVSIDDARGKLDGLGHSAQGITEILANAHAAVKGTAFGLGEAATAAASAVAAGIKPGQDLTKYLTLAGDAATIAGTSLADMGSIFNKVQSSGKAYTDDLNMLADRGVPIFQWLQEEYGVTAEALTKMVKDGKVDSETFRKVIDENIGGSAQKSGATLRGAWANMQASLGRIGEAAMSPFLPIMKNSLGAITRWADQIKPHVEKAAKYVAAGLTDMGRAFQTHGESIEGPASNWEKFGVKARETVDGIKGAFSILKNGDYLGADMTFGFEEDSGLVNFLFKVREGAIALKDAISNRDMSSLSEFWSSLQDGSAGLGSLGDEGDSWGETFTKLGDAVSSVGKSLVSLTGDTGTVAAELIHSLGDAMGFLADNAGFATAGLVGYFGIMAAGNVIQAGYQVNRMIVTPAEIASRIAMTAALNAHVATMKAYLQALGHEIPAQQNAITRRYAAVKSWTQKTFAVQQGTSALYRWSIAATAAAHHTNGLTAALYRGAAGAAAMGARVQAATGTVASGLTRGLSGAMSLIGGPWGAAIAAVGVGFLAYNGHVDRNARLQSALSDATVKGARAQLEFKDAISAANGELSKAAVSSAGDLLEAQMTKITKVAEEGHSSLESFLSGELFSGLSFGDLTSSAVGISGFSDQLSSFFGIDESYDKTQRAIDQSKTLMTVLRDQKLQVSDLGRIVAEGGDKYDTLVTALEATGDAGADVTRTIKEVHTELQGIREAAVNSTPGVGSVTDAIKTLSDESATADERLGALKRALDAISTKPVDLGDAMQSYNKQIRDVIDATKAPWDQSKGFGTGLILDDGSVNTATANGDKLRTTLLELRDETARVAAAGQDMGPIWAQNEQVLADLGRAVGLDVDQMRALAESVGYVPRDIEILAQLKGASGVEGQLTALQVMIDANRDKGFTIDTKLLGSDEVIRQIQAAGGRIEEVTGKPGVFKVDAPNAQNVLDVINDIIKTKIPDKVVTVRESYIPGRAQPGVTTNSQPGVSAPPGNATGGIAAAITTGAISGPGGPTSDSVPALLSAGEHVWTAAEVAAVGGHNKMYSLRSLAKAGGLKFAEGGTPWGIDKAISAARSVEGNTYDWGGTGPTTFDCSGFVGWLQQIAMGVEGSTKRIYTTMSILSGSLAGLESGLGPAGTWFQVGVSNDHMAATIAGMNVESGGAFGTSGIGGGRAGARDSQFPFKFHLPNELIKGIAQAGTRKGGKLIEWTDEDERDLERARIAVTQAEQKRAKVYEDPDSTPEDKRLAELDVDDARDKVLEKQKQKDKQGTIEGGDRVAPEAPALEKVWSEEEADRVDKAQAVESARTKRNEVYDDPDSTDLDKAKADADLSLAMQEEQKGTDSSESATTLKSVFTTAASSAAGALFDAAKEIFLPDTISSSHWWDVADEAISLANSDTDEDGTSNINELLGSIPSFNATDIMSQLGFNGAVPDWAKNKKDVKVFDSGGWLEPGEMGINLSSRPEPIFNSPDQLRQFAGSTLTAPAQATGISREEFERGLMSRPNFTVQTDNVNAAIRELGNEQKRQARTHKRR
ncbi:tape measure protein [Nocardia rhizosphaerihabitans]|uniref:tape measure protein n=1 Tax=Nocardia rhizosphaerihabitans TaxID=1691570 RepID=UPI003670AF57